MIFQILCISLLLSNLAATIHIITHYLTESKPPEPKPVKFARTPTTEKRSPKLVNEVTAENNLKRAQGWD